jgi:hypothetical protein
MTLYILIYYILNLTALTNMYYLHNIAYHISSHYTLLVIIFLILTDLTNMYYLHNIAYHISSHYIYIL